jgi:hypothetical protein
VAGALLVPDQDVLDFALLENLVIDRKHRAAGIAEDMLDAMIDQRAHDHCSAGHLIGIVALVAHGLLRMRCCCAAFFSWISGNKKGPKRPHAHRLGFGMALAIPGGAPGYDDDKQFGNFIAHIAARTSQRLREP